MDHDLNLLYVLVAVADTRQVSKAALRLETSQPGVSNSLRRLRIAYRDPLFVRTSRGMEPTPRAARLIETARAMLALHRREVQGEPAFDPGEATDEFRFAMSDIGEMVFLPRLTRSSCAGKRPGQRYAPSAFPLRSCLI